MPKKSVPQFRCESCLQLHPGDLMHDYSGEHVCLGCWTLKILKSLKAQGLKTGAVPGAKDPKFTAPPVAMPGVGVPVAGGGESDDDLDAHGFGWFAVAHTGSDSRVKKAIFQRARAHGQGHMVKQVMIPKVKATRVTKDRWSVFDLDGTEIGQVTAADHAEAVHKAKEEFTKRKKGVYNPDESEVRRKPYKTLEKVREGKRVVYLAKDEDGKVLGKIRSTKNDSQARKIADNLYGQEKVAHPKAIKSVEIGEVVKVKEGGETYTRNERAMPGYLLVRCKDDDDLHDTIKRTPGVYSMLPFTEKMDYEEWERADEEGAVPKPVPIPTTEVERIGASYRDKARVEVAVGDNVKVRDGIYADSTGVLVALDADEYDPVARVRLTLMGREVEVGMPAAYLTKN